MDRKTFETKEKELGVASAFARMGKWGRLYGTAIIIPIIANDKDGDTSEPLDERTISPDNPVTGLRVLSWPDLAAAQLDRKTERTSMFIDWRDGNRAYHPSRVIGPFDGIELPLTEYRYSAGRGGSVLERCYDSLLNKAQASAQISPLIHEALVKLVGIDDLPRYLSGGADEQKFIQRWIVAKRLASCQNVMLYDKGREEIKDSTAVSALAGLAALLTEFGQSSPGNATSR